MSRVEIYDTTLRDGSQLEGISLTVDDKLRILAAMKASWRERLTTVFVRQGHYAFDPAVLAEFPPADVTLESIGELLAFPLDSLAGDARGAGQSEGTLAVERSES